MSKFEILTKYIPQLKKDMIGDWVIDEENDGTPEHPIQMPFVAYTELVNRFIDDVYEFEATNKDMMLTSYGEILKKNGLRWDMEAMKYAEVSLLDALCVMALIMGAVRAERFCEGALLSFFKNGSMLKWLERLKEFENK